MKLKAAVIYLMSFSGNLLEKLGAKNLWRICIPPETQSGDLQDALSREMMLLRFEPPYLVTQWQWWAWGSVNP